MNKSSHEGATSEQSKQLITGLMEEHWMRKNEYRRNYIICSIQMPSVVTIKTGSDLRWDIKISF